MPIEVVELDEERTVVTGYGSNPTAELHFFCLGATDEYEARDAITAFAPASYDLFGTGIFFLPRSQIAIEQACDDMWEGTIRYEVTPQPNQSEYSFDTGGGMQHVVCALVHIGDYRPKVTGDPAGPAKGGPNHKGLIGVTENGVEGVDIPVPVYCFAETHYIDDSEVTDAYKGLLYSLTGTMNYAAFKGFASGECLFLGASGSKRGSGDWAIAFRFAASPNKTNLRIGDSNIYVDKKGWEYLWIESKKEVVTYGSEKYLEEHPAYAHVEQLYFYGDFSLLGIGT